MTPVIAPKKLITAAPIAPVAANWASGGMASAATDVMRPALCRGHISNTNTNIITISRMPGTGAPNR